MSNNTMTMHDTFNSRIERLRRIQKYYSVHLDELIGLSAETGLWATSCYTMFVANNTVAETKRNKYTIAVVAETKAFGCMKEAYSTLKESGLILFELNDNSLEEYGFLFSFPTSKEKQLNAIQQILDEYELKLRSGQLVDLPKANIIRLKAAYNTALQSRVNYIIAKEEAKLAREEFHAQWQIDSEYLQTQFQWSLRMDDELLYSSTEKKQTNVQFRNVGDVQFNFV